MKVMINISILTEQDFPKGTLVQWQDYLAEFAAFLSQWLFSKYLQCINLLHVRRKPNIMKSKFIKDILVALRHVFADYFI